MSDVHERWLEGAVNKERHRRIAEIDNELAVLKKRYRQVRKDGHGKDSWMAKSILDEAVKLRSEKARVLRMADLFAQALGLRPDRDKINAEAFRQHYGDDE